MTVMYRKDTYKIKEKENGGKENEKDTQNKSFDCNNGCSSCIINDSGVGG